MADHLNITVEFSGGLELLFSNIRSHQLSIPSSYTNDQQQSAQTNIAYLVNYMCQNLMKDPRKEMFLLDGHVRPGILVLINDADWELEGEEEYILQERDNVLFVSTLHGG